MSWLLDVNFILASRWTTHPDHAAAKSWIDSVGAFSTCAITELGFLRISLGPAYQATWTSGLHRTLGFPRFRVLTITSSPERVEHLIVACQRLERGQGLFLFADRTEFRQSDPLTFS